MLRRNDLGCLLIVADKLTKGISITNRLKEAVAPLNCQVATTQASCILLLQTNSYDAIVVDQTWEQESEISLMVASIKNYLENIGRQTPLILIKGLLGDKLTLESLNLATSDHTLPPKISELTALLEQSLTPAVSGKVPVSSPVSQSQNQQFLAYLLDLINANPEPPVLLQTVASWLQEVFNSDVCVALPPNLVAQDSGYYLSEISIPIQKLVEIETRLMAAYHEQLSQGQPLVWTNVDARETPTITATVEAHQICSLLFVPLKYGQSYFGVIGVYNYEIHNSWNARDIELVKIVAVQCAMTIYQKLFQSKLQQQQQRESLLQQMGQSLIAKDSAPNILERLLRQMGIAFGVERVVFYRYDELQLWIEKQWCSQEEIPCLLESLLPLNLCQFLEPRDECFTSTNYATENLPFAEPINKTQHYSTLSLLRVPVWFQEQLVGTLDLQKLTTERNFSSEEIETAQLGSNLVAIAWERVETQKRIAQLEASDRAKSAFLDNTSHELRTPLTGILGFSRLLAEQIYGPLNDKQMQYITALSSCGEHLLSLINDLLDLSKIDAGREELSWERVVVEELCGASLSLVQQQANQGGLDLNLEIEPVIEFCQGDQRRLKQILVNLLSNAVKYTESGSVTLKVEKTADELLFSVIDTGIGMSEKDQRLLFEPFQQIDSHLNRKHKGSGLGLALSLKLAKLHGGDITVQSQLNQGSCFTLHLPL